MQIRPGDDEGQAAGRARPASSGPAGRRRWPARWRPDRQRIPGADGVFEFLCVQPLPAVHAQLAQQRDVRRQTAEADAANPAPLPQHRGQAHLVLRRARLTPGPAGVVADEPEQEADPGPQLGRHPAERLVGVLLTGRVSDAP